MIASLARIMLLTGVISGLQLAGANADDPPILNIGPSCEAAAGAGISLGRDKQACMQEEGAAQDLHEKLVTVSPRRQDPLRWHGI